MHLQIAEPNEYYELAMLQCHRTKNEDESAISLVDIEDCDIKLDEKSKKSGPIKPLDHRVVSKYRNPDFKP